MLGLIVGAFGRDVLCGTRLGMEVGSSQGSKCCFTLHMGPFSPTQVQFSIETPKQMVLFYPGYYSTSNTQVLHTLASLSWREGPG